MMGNLHQNMCFSSPDQNTWSEDTLKRPPSPSLLQSCYQEMEKKGLGLYSHYQNFPAVSDETKTSASCLESRNHGHLTNKNDVPESPPIPCGRQVTTVAEVHNCYLHERPEISRLKECE